MSLLAHAHPVGRERPAVYWHTRTFPGDGYRKLSHGYHTIVHSYQKRKNISYSNNSKGLMCYTGLTILTGDFRLNFAVEGGRMIELI